MKFFTNIFEYVLSTRFDICAALANRQYKLLVGTVQILCDPLRGEGGGHQKITKDHRGGRGGPSKDHVGSQGGGGHGRPPMHYKRAKENLQLS